ncbi:Uncharacterised protein [Mycobacteroides abscessus subsp. abscessus]|nr:Uncharacterised protein [Mycobacteroides abscessus subsp. abscessus]
MPAAMSASAYTSGPRTSKSRSRSQAAIVGPVVSGLVPLAPPVEATRTVADRGEVKACTGDVCAF